MAKPVRKNTSQDTASQANDTSVELVDSADLDENAELENDVPEVDPTAVAKVRVKVAKSVNCYIGDEWYRLSAGSTADIPKNVKEILLGAGYLEAM